MRRNGFCTCLSKPLLWRAKKQCVQERTQPRAWFCLCVTEGWGAVDVQRKRKVRRSDQDSDWWSGVSGGGVRMKQGEWRRVWGEEQLLCNGRDGVCTSLWLCTVSSGQCDMVPPSASSPWGAAGCCSQCALAHYRPCAAIPEGPLGLSETFALGFGVCDTWPHPSWS